MSSSDSEQSTIVDRAMSAFRWMFVLRFAGQLVSWLSTIIVIRFLTPEDYGIIGLAEAFRAFLILFSTMGLAEGLIVGKELKPAMVRQTLGFLIIVNVSLFVIQFISAPYIADFYNIAELELVLRLLAFNYLFIPWISVPSALIRRDLNHKRSAKVFFSVQVLSAAIALILAYSGYGYWALVIPLIFATILRFFWLNMIQSYSRLPSFDFTGAGSLFRFGLSVAIFDLIWVAYNTVDVAIAGRYFEVGMLGLYTVALQLSTMLMTRTMPIFNMVVFPALARLNETATGSNQYLLICLRVSSLVIFPMFFGIAIVCHELIYLFLGKEWTQISTIFAIFSLSLPFRMLAAFLSPAMLAAGAPRVNASNAFATLLFFVAAIFLLLPMELVGLALAWSIASMFIFFLAFFRGARVLSLPLWSLLEPLMAPLLTAALMAIALAFVDLNIGDNFLLTLLSQIVLGAAIYLLGCFLFMRNRTEEFISIVTKLAGRG